MVIWAGLQAKLDQGWKWADFGIDWLIWKMIVSLKKVLCGINFFVNVTGVMKLKLFSNNGFENTFMTNSCVNVKLMHDVLHQQVCITWNQDIFNVDKLRTYVTFKQEYGPENYVKVVTNSQHRAALSQFRCGVLPLKVETERFQDIPVEYRLRIMCEENVIKTESHFLLYCSKYNQLRYHLFY